VSGSSATQQEMRQKEEEQRQIGDERRHGMTECKKSIEEILYKDVCALVTVRNAVLKTSTVSPPEKIVDCEVGDWAPGECSKTCDNTCPQPNPWECGGIQEFTREEIVAPNEFGARCPSLMRKRRCNQVKCPVDCVVSEWSPFSKCTKQCGGGVQARTRFTITQPKHGGLPCSSVQEERSCGTESCSRDCVLSKWSSWGACSAACGGGSRQRKRGVLEPMRGPLGKCAKPSAPERLASEPCNTQNCAGDELCAAARDLVIMVDGSWGVRGFSTLKVLAAEIVERVRPQYHGADGMRVGVVEYGNGDVGAGGTITPALSVVELTDDMESAKAGIEGLQQKWGFANLAEGLTAAMQMLDSGRKNVQGAVLVLSSGQPFFSHNVGRKVQELADKGILRHVAFISTVRYSRSFSLLRSMASHPASDNALLVNYREAISSPGTYAESILTKFCPKSISPSQELEQSSSLGFMLVAERRVCGSYGRLLSWRITDPEACFQLAQEAGAQSFALGRGLRLGWCTAMETSVTPAVWEGWQANPEAPECPETASGNFERSPFYNYYAIKPSE